MQSRKPIASLSLDLDNKWSYMKTHGDPGWEKLPSYLDLVVPRALETLKKRNLKITFFVVGQDAAQPRNHAALRRIAEEGHEIGNHSYHHEPWLHLYSVPELEAELSNAENAIQSATGVRPIGFRGPGFSISRDLIDILTSRGYLYDASTFPTFLGPLARAYYFMKSRLNEQQHQERKNLFGSLGDGLRPLRPYRWNSPSGHLIEIPVTTMPFSRLPIHVSYLIYLSTFSAGLALSYFRAALNLCHLTRTEPSLLLHPLDFLGCDDESDLSFFPAMNMRSAKKLVFLEQVLDIFHNKFDVVSMKQHAIHASDRSIAHFAPEALLAH
jgi:peptidoglycan-N-acetylglucosamine deacetylase